MMKIILIITILLSGTAAAFSDGWETGVRYGTETVGAIGFQQEGLTLSGAYTTGDIFKIGLSCRVSPDGNWTRGTVQLEGSVCAPLDWYRPEIGLGLYFFGASAKDDPAPLPEFLSQYGIYALIKPVRINLREWFSFSILEAGKDITPTLSFAELRFGPLVPIRYRDTSVPDYAGDFFFLEFSPISINVNL